MSIPKLKAYLNELDDSLSMAESQQDKLEFLIEIGKQLQVDSKLLINPNFKVKGCASNTFVGIKIDSQNSLNISSYTDSFVVAGYLKIFEQALNGLNSSDLVEAIEVLKVWLHQNGFDTGIVPTRIEASGRILEKIGEIIG